MKMKKSNEEQKTGASFINFARPDITVLREQRKKHEIQCDKPGIIQSNIDTVICVGVHGRYFFGQICRYIVVVIDGDFIAHVQKAAFVERDLHGYMPSDRCCNAL